MPISPLSLSLVKIFRKIAYIVLPGKLKLSFLYWFHCRFEDCENELLYLRDFAGERLHAAIDVGANKGFFSYALARHSKKVYSFEINNELTKDLQAYNSGNIEIIHCGLSSKKGDATLYIPRKNGQLLTGWASLRPGNCPGIDEHLEKDVSICTLDELDLRDISFIKIDVEGHEIEVLKGAINTLRQYSPRVLVEVKDENIQQVFSFFQKLHYTPHKLEDFVLAASSHENYIFLPDSDAIKSQKIESSASVTAAPL